VGNLRQDVRFALRGFRRNPGFTAVAVGVLALGIGANSAIFSVVNAVLLRPLGYREPERIMTVLDHGRGPLSPANFLDLRAQSKTFERLAAAQAWGGTLTGSGAPEAFGGLQVTAELFPLLGVEPFLGRTFLPGEDRPGAGRAVVLTHGLWKRRFGGDRNLVGRSLVFDGERYTVVGVMPPGFQFAPFWITSAEIFVPFDLTARLTDRDGASLRVFGRLAPGVTRAQAQAELTGLTRQLARQYPGANADLDVVVDPLHEKAVGNVRRALLVLLGAVSLVLLIACANVANLLMARAASRGAEIAIRTALGAGRGRLVRQLLTESALLGCLGGGLGLLLAQWGIDLLVAFSPAGLPRANTIDLDGRVVAFTLGLSLMTALLFGLGPALRASGLDLNAVLRGGSRSVSESRNRLRSVLIVSEVALALVLLIGGGLLMRSFQRLLAVDAGLDPHRVLNAVVSLGGGGFGGNNGPTGGRYQTPEERARFFAALVERVRALPGVEAASAINHLPIDGDMWSMGVTVEGRPGPAPGGEWRAVYRVAQPGYLDSLGIHLVAGRDFTRGDAPGTPGVAIVNESFARAVWPDAESVIGKRFTLVDGGPNPREIVGVIKDVKQREWAAQPAPEMYLAYFQNPNPRSLTVVARTSQAPASFAALLAREVRALDENVPAPKVRSMDDVVTRALGQPRFNLLLLNAFAGLALLLAAVGIYGVMAYSVTRRTRELGIRIALGAGAARVVRLVVGQGMLLTALGVAIGLAVAFATTRVMATLLFGVAATDPVTFVFIPLLLLAVGFAACYLPARRATRIDPMVALRGE
jgi:putative ABC transport system permease protein